MRQSLTKFRPALSGYQKGRCFYCLGAVELSDGEVSHVDHFFPWSLEFLLADSDLNGVWNLVLACADCNAGKGGKFDAIPAQRFLEKLHRRNSSLIDSHHPMREPLMLETERSAQERWTFLHRLWDQMRVPSQAKASGHPFVIPLKVMRPCRTPERLRCQKIAQRERVPLALRTHRTIPARSRRVLGLYSSRYEVE